MASLIGVDLGVSLDMVEFNLDLIKSNEKARMELFLASKREKSNTLVEHEVLHSDDVDFILLELLHMSREGDDDTDPMENFHIDMSGFRGGGVNANNSHFEAVAVETLVKTVLRRKRKKKS